MWRLPSQSPCDISCARPLIPASGNPYETTGTPSVQVSDSMLEAAARIQSLTAVDTGLSSLCTQKGVLKLLQLTGLQALSAIGRSAQDFGLLQLEDVRRLAALTSLRLLEVCRLRLLRIMLQRFATQNVLSSLTLVWRMM